MNPYQQIDNVFFFIKDKEEHSASFSTEYIWNMYVNKTPELGINRMMYEEIIKQLVEDGFISESFIPDAKQKMYHVTFKGRLFTGYEKRQELLTQENKRVLGLEVASQKYQADSLKNSQMLNRLTWILAIGTSLAAVYYLFEILNHWMTIYP